MPVSFKLFQQIFLQFEVHHVTTLAAKIDRAPEQSNFGQNYDAFLRED